MNVAHLHNRRVYIQYISFFIFIDIMMNLIFDISEHLNYHFHQLFDKQSISQIPNTSQIVQIIFREMCVKKYNLGIKLQAILEITGTKRHLQYEM